jgi:Domain of unknown function (DUF5666)
VRFSIPITAIAAVLLLACGGGAARTSSSTARPSPAGSPRAGFGGNAVGGKLTRLNGAQLVLAAQSGDVDVTYDGSTRVLRTSAGSLGQAAPGTCVSVTGQKDASGAVTATTVNLMLDMNGVCTQPSPGAGAGGAGGQGRGAGRQGGANPNLAFVRGKITAVQGQALTVLDVSGAPTAVNVTDTTRYTRTEAATTGQLAVGQCIVASGQRDAASGAVAARQLSIADPGPNGCATGFQGGPRQGGSPAPSA